MESRKPYVKPQIKFYPAGSPQFIALMSTIKEEKCPSTDQPKETEKETEKKYV